MPVSSRLGCSCTMPVVDHADDDPLTAQACASSAAPCSCVRPRKVGVLFVSSRIGGLPTPSVPICPCAVLRPAPASAARRSRSSHGDNCRSCDSRRQRAQHRVLLRAEARCVQLGLARARVVALAGFRAPSSRDLRRRLGRRSRVGRHLDHVHFGLAVRRFMSCGDSLQHRPIYGLGLAELFAHRPGHRPPTSPRPRRARRALNASRFLPYPYLMSWQCQDSVQAVYKRTRPLTTRRADITSNRSQNISGKRVRCKRKFGDRTSAEQVLLDDSLDVFGRCVPVPRAFRVHEHDRALAADAQAIDARA